MTYLDLHIKGDFLASSESRFYSCPKTPQTNLLFVSTFLIVCLPACVFIKFPSIFQHVETQVFFCGGVIDDGYAAIHCA